MNKEALDSCDAFSLSWSVFCGGCSVSGKSAAIFDDVLTFA
jgi:hypothetical protein